MRPGRSKGKSARLIVTMEMPGVTCKWYFFEHSLKSLKRNILGFVGMKPVRETVIGIVEGTNHDKWLAKVRELGRDMTFRTTLISCGILSSLWYAAINVFVPLQWPEYSVVDLTVSELSAIGAPTRALWVAVVVPYTLLFAFFGWGVLRSAADNKWLRVTGWLIILYSAFNTYWPPMHTREILAAGGGTLTDTLHLTWAGVTVFLFMLIFAFGAASQDKRFRIYTIVSAITLLTFGLLTALAAPNVEANLPTPRAGLYERINVGVFLLWVIVLATILLRTSRTKTFDSATAR